MTDCPKCLEVPGFDSHTCGADALDEPETIQVPVLEGTFPVVLYLGSEDDREELIQVMMQIHPNMRSAKL